MEQKIEQKHLNSSATSVLTFNFRIKFDNLEVSFKKKPHEGFGQIFISKPTKGSTKT